MTQLNPTFGKTVTDSAALVGGASALEPAALAGQRAPAQEVNCGSNFFVVPVATRKAVDAAAIDRAKRGRRALPPPASSAAASIFSTEGQIRRSGTMRWLIWSPAVGCC